MNSTNKQMHTCTYTCMHTHAHTHTYTHTLAHCPKQFLLNLGYPIIKMMPVISSYLDRKKDI